MSGFVFDLFCGLTPSLLCVGNNSKTNVIDFSKRFDEDDITITLPTSAGDYYKALDYTKMRLTEIAEDTILDPKQLEDCLKMIQSAGSDFLSLFDYMIDRRQRTSHKIGGQYLPCTLKNEIQELLTSPVANGISRAHRREFSPIDSEVKLQLLCLYLLWTSDTVLEVSSGQSLLGPRRLQSLQYVVDDDDERDDDASFPSLHSGNKSSNNETSWYITFKSMMSSTRTVVDLRILLADDLIPSHSHLGLEKALIRGSSHMLEALVSKDLKRFETANYGHGLYITQRKHGSKSTMEDFSLKSFSTYSLEQAQLVAQKHYAKRSPFSSTSTEINKPMIDASNLRSASTVSSNASKSRDKKKLKGALTPGKVQDVECVSLIFVNTSTAFLNSKPKSLRSSSDDQCTTTPIGSIDNVPQFELKMLSDEAKATDTDV